MKAWTIGPGTLRDFSNAFYRCREFHPGTGTVNGFEEVRAAGQACALEVLGMAGSVIEQAYAAADALVISATGPHDLEDGETAGEALQSLPQLRCHTKVYRITVTLACALANFRAAQAACEDDRLRWSALHALIEALVTQGAIITKWIDVSEAAARRHRIFLR